jgi:hypothetical protein
VDGIRKQCCCPSLIITIAGPWIAILGAVFLDYPVVQPLTDFLWVGDNPQQPSRLTHLTRVFHCVSLALQELREYYGGLPDTGNPPGRFFPYVTHYLDSSNRRIEFSYISKLDKTNDSKAIFLARTQDTNEPKTIVVKFVQSYNSEAHALLQEHGLAPALLYDGSRQSETRFASDRSMIIMDFVRGVDLDLHTERPTPPCILKDVRKALQLLHDHDIVFGDLRPPNVMAVQDADGRATGGMLVDFDWCGKHGEGVYPLCMNQVIKWAAGMEPGETMYKHHDDAMFLRL